MSQPDASDDPADIPLRHSVLPRAAVRIIEREGGRLAYSTLYGWIQDKRLTVYRDAAGADHVDMRDVRRVWNERKDLPFGRPPRKKGGE